MISRLLDPGGPGMRLQPYRYASERRELRLRERLDAFERLMELVEGVSDEVRAVLRFRRDDEGYCRIEGEAETRVRMRCANCEELGELTLEAEVALCVVSSGDAAAQIAPASDPLVMDKDHLTPAELLEDDLLLNLPERPCRGDPRCPFRPAWQPDGPVAEPERENPFQALEQLKRSEFSGSDDSGSDDSGSDDLGRNDSGGTP